MSTLSHSDSIHRNTNRTNPATKKIKAVALISGGLDSLLAAHLIQQQGIIVQGLNFYTGFCHSGHTSAIRKRRNDKPKRNDALWVAKQLGIKLEIVDIVEEYKSIVINPKHDYGKYLNPCLDCKVFMIKRAYAWMQENDFDFIITGEVIGQRPKSQNKKYLPLVSHESGALDRLLRPLCAKLLPETLPEREGWVSREALKDFSGRSRRGQIALAAEFGFEEYAQPSGGCCVLTDEHYSRRLADHWQAKGERDYELEDVILLKIGRHLRLAPHLKIIVGRDEGENNFLAHYKKRFLYLSLVNVDGPLVLVDGNPAEVQLNLIARIAARYSQGRHAPTVTISAHFLDKTTRELVVTPLREDAVLPEWHV